MKQVLILLAVLAFFLVATALQAQSSGSLQGTVVDENEEPIPGATVIVVGTNRGSATNVDGEYLITGLAVGTYTLQVTSLTSADTLYRTIVIQEDEKSLCSFTLNKDGGEYYDVDDLPRGNTIRFIDANTTGKITEISGENMLRWY